MGVFYKVLQKIQIHLMLIFIVADIKKRKPNTNSNTSHVNLYRQGTCSDFLFSYDSNTSHVNLYLGSLQDFDTVTLIQIHLMLIFI